MRMWMVNPRKMCRQHLLGEHFELHLFASAINSHKKIQGFLDNNELEPLEIRFRHAEIVIEMESRGYKHNSPLPDRLDINSDDPRMLVKINRQLALNELLSRCSECRGRFLEGYYA